MSISTGPVIPLSCILITIRDTAVSFALFHWWFISGFNTWLIIWLNRIQWRWDHWDHEQKLIQHQMSYFPEHLSKLRAHRVCSEQLFDAGKRLLPEFQNKSLAGNFGPQIWLPDGHFGQFRAIGPMELLRPATACISQCEAMGQVTRALQPHGLRIGVMYPSLTHCMHIFLIELIHRLNKEFVPGAGMGWYIDA